MKTIAFLNQKGGVGKTSTCHHLAGAFAGRGLRVLLVDNDPQSSLTQGMFGPDEARDLDPASTIAAVHQGGDPHPGALIRPTSIAGVDLVPGSRACARWNVPCPSEVDPDRQFALDGFLGSIEGYDLALVDCPPNLHLASWTALVAADHLIVPLQPEDYASQGLADVLESVALVVEGPNPRLTVLGYLLTRVVARKTVHRFYEDRLRRLYGREVFETRVPDAVAYVEAIMARKPVQHYAPRSAAAVAMRALSVEVLRQAGISSPMMEVL